MCGALHDAEHELSVVLEHSHGLAWLPGGSTAGSVVSHVFCMRQVIKLAACISRLRFPGLRIPGLRLPGLRIPGLEACAAPYRQMSSKSTKRNFSLQIEISPRSDGLFAASPAVVYVKPCHLEAPAVSSCSQVEGLLGSVPPLHSHGLL